MGFSAKQKEIYDLAVEHSGRYLLPRRYSKGNREVDELYDACEALIDSGHAKWLPSYASSAPGIVLTGKPQAA